jgi:tRNA-Thr(GGU) m(6)t(6)A37 methyltransferase TsaA
VLQLTPIGVIRTPFTERVQAPRQPAAAEGVPGRIELEPGRGFEDAAQDLDRWEHLWVLFWFDRNTSWRPKVQPPRSERKRGVFATRSPYRPNPLGMSVVRFERLEGLTIHVLDVDMLDGSPVLDIKPYLAWADARPGSGGGWLVDLDDRRIDRDSSSGAGVPDDASAAADGSPAPGSGSEGRRPVDPAPPWDVRFDALAREQLAFLREHGVDLEAPVRAALALGPQPHAYRRIKDFGSRSRLAIKAFRIWFRREPGRSLVVETIESGYRPRELRRDNPEMAVHRQLTERFPGRP